MGNIFFPIPNVPIMGRGGSVAKTLSLSIRKEEGTVFLRRKITLTRAIALAVGTMVGSGIFISPKGVLQNSGNVGVSLLLWLVCGILSLFGALSYADLGTCITKSGGHYIYLLETLGPLPAFLRLWAEFIMIRPANMAVVSLAFGRYLIEPFFASCHVPPLAVKLVTMAGITVALNCWSVSWAAKVQTGLTVLKMITVCLIIVPGILLAHGSIFAGKGTVFTVSRAALWATSKHPAGWIQLVGLEYDTPGLRCQEPFCCS
uniref:Cystine/glutamate transporter n=1 Tax=Laticauda laticaudata TaxID=8630 RepID=A0A8C5WTM1_LATLA